MRSLATSVTPLDPLLTAPAFVWPVLELPRGGADQDPHKKRKKKKKRRDAAPEAPSDQSTETLEGEDNIETVDEPPLDPKLQAILDAPDFYQILGVPRTATSDAIQKAYRRRCLITHPDKTNGDRRAFDKVAKAYEVLSDEQQRKVYDRFGEKGLDQSQTISSPDDLFRSFFGSSFGGAANPFSRNRTVRYQIQVTLEDLFHGVDRSILLSPPTHNQNHKRVQVHIPRGTLNGQSIVLSGEYDFIPDAAPGDVVLNVHERPHALFTRKNYDLALVVPISLAEALGGGVQRQFLHLNGRAITVVSPADRPIDTGDVQVVKGLGMPKDAQGLEFGDLYVQYQVEMPNWKQSSRLSDEDRRTLVRLLHQWEGTKVEAPSEEAERLEPAHASDFGVASGQPSVTSSDEHEEGGFTRFGANRFYFGGSSGGGFAGQESTGECQPM